MSGDQETKKPDKASTDTASEATAGERIAKVMARAGLCSRRDAEAWIEAGRVTLNGKKLRSPAVNVQPHDDVRVDGKPLPEAEKTRLFRYHKPRGLVTTAKDPEGRPTVFDNLPESLPRVISIGRLDLNSEGLLLLTNDGELARRLELPATGWVRRYRVRVNGHVDPANLTRLAKGIEVEGVRYGAIEATLDRQQGDNAWLTMGLTEGKNREIRKVCAFFGWTVSRLIRLSYGPFQLGHLEKGEIEEVPGKVLRDQLGQPGAAQPLRPHQAHGGKARPPKQAEGKPRAKHIRPDRVYDDRPDLNQNPRPYDRKPARIWKYVERTDAAKPADGKSMPEKPLRDRPRRDDRHDPQRAPRQDRASDDRRDERRSERPQKYTAASEAASRKQREWAGKDTRPSRDDTRPSRVATQQERRQEERKPERPTKHAIAAEGRQSAGGRPAVKGQHGDNRAKTKPADLNPRGSKSAGSKPSRDTGGDKRTKGGPAKHAHRQRRP